MLLKNNKIYQRFKIFIHWLLISHFGATSYCKHQPSCSEYFAAQTRDRGIIKGGFKGLIRILTCI